MNRTVEAVAKGQNRILLVMATGTGKTITALAASVRLYEQDKRRLLLIYDFQ